MPDLNAPLYMEFEQDINLVADNKFQVHPEAYSPRIFVKTADGHYCEILRDGNALPWTAKPQGFDYWVIETLGLGNINMERHAG